MSSYNAITEWSAATIANESYPSEYLIRTFRGKYPSLKMSKPQKGSKVLDVGFGDGRHLSFFANEGLDVYGTEISEQIISDVCGGETDKKDIGKRFKVGTCAHIPFEDSQFDYVVAWNSSYYMSLDGASYEDHVKEFCRVLKPGGWLVLSVPKSTSFILEGSEFMDEKHRVIRRDPFNIRNGEVFRVFETKSDLERVLEGMFNSFCHADIHDDCYGWAYHWFVVVCQKV